MTWDTADRLKELAEQFRAAQAPGAPGVTAAEVMEALAILCEEARQDFYDRIES